jgi:hypothetical protein
MTLYQFKKLNEERQAEIFCEQGVYLACRYYHSEIISLWQVEDFYVELFYDQIEENILRLRSFQSPIPLEPYLKQIDVSQHLQK